MGLWTGGTYLASRELEICAKVAHGGERILDCLLSISVNSELCLAYETCVCEPVSASVRKQAGVYVCVFRTRER